MNIRTIGVAITLAATAIVAVACDNVTPTEVSTLTPASDVASDVSEARRAGARAIRCPSKTTTHAAALVGPLGGIVSVGGTRITIPAGALLAPVNVTVTVPASRFLEIDISVSGVEHFVFELPVVVSVSYARCDRSSTRAPLSAWYFEGNPRHLLELMPSVDNKLTRTVTFTTGHLSGYIVAN